LDERGNRKGNTHTVRSCHALAIAWDAGDGENGHVGNNSAGEDQVPDNGIDEIEFARRFMENMKNESLEEGVEEDQTSLNDGMSVELTARDG
jgi:hypothetical protein